MNIGIIGSGGDGPGMNGCLYWLCKKLKKHNIIAFNYGYQGIIDNNIANYTLADYKAEKKKGGIIIKSSRSNEFRTPEGINKAIANLQSNNIDVLIIMGGNGSLIGAKELIKRGVNVIFIPTTIDNDVQESDYSIGFDTAVNNAVDFICKVDTSMKAFDRICIYEVMGRFCPDISNAVAKRVNASYTYTDKSNKIDMLETVKKSIANGDYSPIVILQENTIAADELKKYLAENLNRDVKYAIVGYVQRGGFATDYELKMSRAFADVAVKCVQTQHFNVLVRYNSETKKFESIEI